MEREKLNEKEFNTVMAGGKLPRMTVTSLHRNPPHRRPGGDRRTCRERRAR